MPKGGGDVREKAREEARQHPLIQPMLDSGVTDTERAQWGLDVDWERNEFQIQLLALVNQYPIVKKKQRDIRGMSSLPNKIPHLTPVI